MSLVFSPLSPAIGAEVAGLDLAHGSGIDDAAALRAALLKHKVLFFRDPAGSAAISTAQFRNFGRLFGNLESTSPSLGQYVRPGVAIDADCPEVMRITYDRDVVARENFWHFDLASTLHPSAGTMLIAREIPSNGGDTLFADMASVYDGLDDTTKARIDGLTGLHDFVPMRRVLRAKGANAAALSQWDASFPLVEIPLVREHPLTGRRTLCVCETYTMGIAGMEDAQAAKLIDQLVRQIWLPEHQCRFRWSEGTIAIWDNTACQHYAARDYWPARRVMERMVLATLFGEGQQTAASQQRPEPHPQRAAN
jgi:taurine dioxygenase